MFALVASVFALPLLAGSVFAADQCARTYTVQPGDTCDSISAANNASTYQLATVNPSINDECTNLMPQQQLCLGFVGSDCKTTYVVKSGDTCASIADNVRMANSTVVLAQNPNVDPECANIYIGEVLCTGEGKAPSSPSNKPVQKPIPAGQTPASPQATHTSAPKLQEEDDDDEPLPFCDEL